MSTRAPRVARLSHTQGAPGPALLHDDRGTDPASERRMPDEESTASPAARSPPRGRRPSPPPGCRRPTYRVGIGPVEGSPRGTSRRRTGSDRRATRGTPSLVQELPATGSRQTHAGVAVGATPELHARRTSALQSLSACTPVLASASRPVAGRPGVHDGSPVMWTSEHQQRRDATSYERAAAQMVACPSSNGRSEWGLRAVSRRIGHPCPSRDGAGRSLSQTCRTGTVRTLRVSARRGPGRPISAASTRGASTASHQCLGSSSS
jgi:hypothetical protein